LAQARDQVVISRNGSGTQPASAEQYRQAFLPLDEEPGGEVLLSMIGRFMTPTQLGFRALSRGVLGFNQPG
jgi:hypothetical protein